jgi:chorismate synthase
MSNSFGKLFTITSFGESHGRLIGVIIDGCPAGLAITENDIQKELDKRKSSETPASTTRREEDKAEVLSGIFNGHTTGAPVCLAVFNKDIDSREYERDRFIPRPGHSDYISHIKYGGFGDYRGGGRFSGRITAGFVMAGAIAHKLLDLIKTEVMAHTIEIGGITVQHKDFDEIRRGVTKNPLRCADAGAAREMMAAIEEAGKQGDSLGGIIEGIALGLPAGLGEPVFDALDAELAKALFAIPSVKGVEFGTGFPSTRRKGSENNDPIAIENGKLVTISNNAGGILGGISNGMPLVMRIAIKPTASIYRRQQPVNIKEMTSANLELKGRHDVCIVPRAVAVVEAMMAITLCDFALRASKIPRVIK